MTVRRWKDVTISGGDMFLVDDPEDELMKASDLRKQLTPAQCSTLGIVNLLFKVFFRN